MSAKLVFLSGDLEGAVVSLLDQGCTIGRNPEEDLVLPDEVVSRRQATLRYRDGQYVIRDEASTNGTFVNDRRITEQVLHDGDVIEYGLGGPSARFEAEAPVQGAPTANEPREESTATPATATRRDPQKTPEPAGPGDATAVFFHEREAVPQPEPKASLDDDTLVPWLSRVIRWRRKRPLAIAVVLIAVLVLIAVAAVLLL